MAWQKGFLNFHNFVIKQHGNSWKLKWVNSTMLNNKIPGKHWAFLGLFQAPRKNVLIKNMVHGTPPRLANLLQSEFQMIIQMLTYATDL